MGLDTTHNCWHGSYSSFNAWRSELARAAGMPPLLLMEGFYKKLNRDSFLEPTLHFDQDLPIKWEILKPDPLHLLLNHSDCEGDLKWSDCADIASSIAYILPNVSTRWKERTQTFIDGLKQAHEAKEDVEFN